MTALQQLRQKFQADFDEAIRHIDWLEAYEQRMPGSAQHVMVTIDRDAQSLPVAPPIDPIDDLNRLALIRESVFAARGEFTVNEVIAYLRAKFPTLPVSRKYVIHVLYKMEREKSIRLTRKGSSGNPNRYVLANLSAVNGQKEEGAA